MLNNTISTKKLFIYLSLIKFYKLKKNKKKEIENESLNLFTYVFKSSTDLCHNLLGFEVLLVHSTRWTCTYTSTTSFT